MAKTPPDPRHVEVRAVKRGTVVVLRAQVGEGAVKERVLHDGLYFAPLGAPHGFFIEDRQLWQELDKLLD